MTQTDITCAYHLRYGLEPRRRKQTATRICKLIRGLEARADVQHIDAIAVRGLSGLLFGPIVAMRLNKTLLVVRKGESCHSTHEVEGDYSAKTYIILDDFVSSGATVRDCFAKIKSDVPAARCVGMVCYNNFGCDGDDIRAFKTTEELRCYIPDIRVRK